MPVWVIILFFWTFIASASSSRVLAGVLRSATFQVLEKGQITYRFHLIHIISKNIAEFRFSCEFDIEKIRIETLGLLCLLTTLN